MRELINQLHACGAHRVEAAITHTYPNGATLTRKGRTLILVGADDREIDRATFDTVQTAVILWCAEAAK